MSTEIFEAIDQQDIDRISSLLENGYDPNTILEKSPYWRPLEAAIEEIGLYDGSIEIVRILLRFGADPNAWDGQHRVTPLHSAIRYNNKEAIQLLLEAGANPNAVSNLGESALSWAVEQNDYEMVKLFLRFGADKTINEFTPPCGYTPLTMAARQMNVKMIELLLSAGADPNALDEDCCTALMRLPPREFFNPKIWDKALELLTR